MNLRNLAFCLILIICSARSPLAAERQLTIYPDGAVISMEGTAKKGLLELKLPLPVKGESLRVKPLDQTGAVQKVELIPYRPSERIQKEVDSLNEQRLRLEDRLRALDTREGIFAAAAKSQSSKAPRKTKSNPDPLSSVRQGTDFAIAQLESVYTARRRTEQELKRIDARLLAIRRQELGGQTVHVQVTPAGGKVRVLATLQDGNWVPLYDVRLQDGEAGLAKVTLLAENRTKVPEGFDVRISSSPLAADRGGELFRFTGGGVASIATFSLAVDQQQITPAIPSFSITLRNNSGETLPSGSGSFYYNGEYLGKMEFPAIKAGAAASISGPL